MIKGCSLFSNVGIDEYYFKEAGIEMRVANELIPKRARFYSEVYPNVNMICGDISDNKTFKEIEKRYKESGCSFLLATPPCQSFSCANTTGKEEDERTYLFEYILSFIACTKPDYIMIENVPQFLKQKIPLIDKLVSIKNRFIDLFEDRGYNYYIDVLDSADYDTPQHRKRAIILASKKGKWIPPLPHKHITLQEAIGDLPSLESGQDSGIKYHKSIVVPQNHIDCMSKTPTGKSAFDYSPPLKENGEVIKGFHSTYSRLSWDKPSTTLTSNSYIGSTSNCHPGHLKKDGTYSDARPLTILELLRITGLPDDYPIPEWAGEGFVREVIGEAFPPKFALNLLKTMPI